MTDEPIHEDLPPRVLDGVVVERVNFVRGPNGLVAAETVVRDPATGERFVIPGGPVTFGALAERGQAEDPGAEQGQAEAGDRVVDHAPQT